MTSGRKRTIACGLTLAAVLAYGAWIEPRRLTVSHVAVRLDSPQETSAGVKVALLSDLHLGPGTSPLEGKLLARLAELRPDLILLAGDYVEWGGTAPAYEHALNFLARLQAPLGVYGVLGDADIALSRKSCEFCHLPGSGSPTDRHSVVFLRNAARTVDLPNGALRLVGITTNQPRPSGERLRQLLPGDVPTILLSHSSDVYAEVDSSAAVLAVSGDTHGGQVWLPRWLWRLMRLKPDREHLRGHFRDGRKSLVVTRGIGTSRFPFRIGSPPEIVVLELTGAAR